MAAAKRRKTRNTMDTVGWRTSDEHEIELRRERGAAEVGAIEKLDERRELFGAYRVRSASGEAYVVEIRSLSEPVNSCGCADHRANGLGTCKHVEGVLHRLRARRGHRAAMRSGNPATELFLDAREGRPAVQWCTRRGRRNKAERIVEAACSQSGLLSAPALCSLARIETELAALPPAQRAQVRVSRYLEDWRDRERDRESAQRERAALERALDDGKPALELLRVPLYPYQQQGVLHLAFTRRALLADEMGLGKTIQAIGACELLARREGVSRVLVVTPASLKGEWAEQIAAFTERSVNLVDGSARARRGQYRRPAFFHLVNYEQVRQDADLINEVLAPQVVILDEAQRIKNWRTVTAMQVKRLRSRCAFVLTGTPLENRIDEVYSIAQFLDPALFGSLFKFNREFYVLDDRGRPAGYRNLDEMHRRLQPVMLRRRKAEVETELPGRSVTNHFVALSPEQEEQYAAHQGEVARLVSIARRRPLRQQEFERLQRSLACMRMACDTPFILDRQTRVSPKLDELVPLLEELLDGTGSKAVVFSEWERMLQLARERTRSIAPDPAWHTGATPQKKRRSEIRRFKEDPHCRILFSTDSGSVGLNLQVADVVINLDLPWNPAKLEQRIARAWRKHQRRHVRVINLVSEGTIEHRMLDTLEHKRRIAESVIDGDGGAGTTPLRSGRAALIERVEALTGSTRDAVPGQTEQPSPASSPEPLAERIAQLLGDALVEVRQFDEPGRAPSLLVISRADDANTRAAIERCVDATSQSPRPRLELVDAATWLVIDRLVQAGMLRPGAGAPAGTEPAADEARLAHRRECAARAGQVFANAQRQQSMARLLSGGGFVPEAVDAMRSAFDAVNAGLAMLDGDDCDRGEHAGARNALGMKFRLPEQFAACRESLDGDVERVDVHACLSVIDRALADAAHACGDALQ